jgi:hypothetical protein
VGKELGQDLVIYDGKLITQEDVDKAEEKKIQHTYRKQQTNPSTLSNKDL